MSEVLTAEQILETAEEVLRRYGPAKATVVDVARALGVSHGSVYRHFPSKAALRDTVAGRWLERLTPALTAIAAEDALAADRLRRWLEALIHSKHTRAKDDPELFATYLALAYEAREVVKAHVEILVGQITAIVTDGVARGEFTTPDPAIAARAVFDATFRFHNPAHAADWTDPEIGKAFDAVWALILCGLSGTIGR
ncbi:MAG: TetR family transcriptional regulator [Capsulimonas sp.]|uniref:TetR family transcriptional regulator n=1 Tax=Capsulimonas sp. TaxID=2494211 RepID=UPI0032646123